MGAQLRWAWFRQFTYTRPSSTFTAFIKRWEWTGNDLLNENVLLISWFPFQIKVIYSFSSFIHLLHLFNEINSREVPAKASHWISIPWHKWTSLDFASQHWSLESLLTRCQCSSSDEKLLLSIPRAFSFPTSSTGSSCDWILPTIKL